MSLNDLSVWLLPYVLSSAPQIQLHLNICPCDSPLELSPGHFYPHMHGKLMVTPAFTF